MELLVLSWLLLLFSFNFVSDAASLTAQESKQHQTTPLNDYSDYKVIRCNKTIFEENLYNKRSEINKNKNKNKNNYYYENVFKIDNNSDQTEDHLDIWAKSRDFIDIRIHKGDHVPKYCNIMIEDVQSTIDKQMVLEEEKEENNKLSFLKQSAHPFFNTYQNLDEINNWLSELSSNFSELVSMEIVGQTFEGREMKALHISSTEVHSNDTIPNGKKTIVITGGVHAREWVSVSTVCYIAFQLLSRYGHHKRETAYINNLDFLIIPVFNPDGYSYTWTHDRLWRKNRQQTYFPRCFGIDIDHSFDFQWTGTSDFPCSEDYSGESPFEALEADNWNKYLTMKKGDYLLHGYLDFHSYSQEILYPYGYSCDAIPRDLENLLELSYGLARAIRKKSKRKYNVMSSCLDRGSDLTPGLGSGSALDYMYHHRAHWAFQLKLRDTGNHGFLLPAKHIVPVGKESYAAIKYFCDFILNPDL
ncbi:related to Putative metallocarboxypeptidase ECM14 [Saccharomycodes ludwigii]|uniref:Inactive metallocarboxypeptidase ECM14 n=1 Tax=Saccharomycodes ludwigii TaxID=36035 RepID=A0A376BBX8_9ASCO|nr:related to Putative metallocarboxypeptidase ECM14 [Saccharomycodes ludwigii]